MKDSIKRSVLVFFAKFFGKAMFASLRLYGITAMIISDPSTEEILMEFPRQAWFRSGETDAKEEAVCREFATEHPRQPGSVEISKN
jgi:hypothetical protein